MKRIFIILFVFVFFPSQLFSKSPFDYKKNHDPVLPRIKIKVLPSKSVILPGEEFKFYISVILEEGWHIYSLSPFLGNKMLETKIFIDENVFTGQGVWKEPKPVLIKDGAVGKIVKGHKGNIEFSRTYLVPNDLGDNKYFLKGKLVVRTCNNKVCSLPQELPFHSVIQVKNRVNRGIAKK